MRSETSRKPLSAFGSLLRGLGLITMGGSMMLGALLIVGIGQSGNAFLNSFRSWFGPAKSEPQVDVRSVVVKQIQDASELTTAVFTMEAVVPTKQDAQFGGFVLGTTKLLYVAYGQVRAGVDLSQIQATDVQANGEQLMIRLPAPKLLDSKIDVSRSNVYDYSRGWLGLGPDAAPELQTLAQQTALERVVSAACQEGILQKANDRAKLVVSQLVKVPPYQSVNVQLTTPTSCDGPANQSPSSTAPTNSVTPIPQLVPSTTPISP